MYNTANMFCVVVVVVLPGGPILLYMVGYCCLDVAVCFVFGGCPRGNVVWTESEQTRTSKQARRRPKISTNKQEGASSLSTSRQEEAPSISTSRQEDVGTRTGCSPSPPPIAPRPPACPPSSRPPSSQHGRPAAARNNRWRVSGNHHIAKHDG